MINVSVNASAAINRDSRRFSARFLLDGNVIDGSIKHITVNKGSCGEADFVPGVLYSSFIDAVIDYCPIALERKELLLQFGVLVGDEYEWSDIGYFKVINPATSAYTTTFTAIGRLSSKAGRLYVSELSYPATIQAVLDEISAQIGVPIDASEFDTSGVINTKPSGYMHREVLAYIAGLFFGYVTETADGQIRFGKFSTENIAETDGDRTTQLPTFADIDTEVTGVSVTTSVSNEDGSATEEVFTSGVVSVALENPFMTQALFNANVGNIIGFKYRSGYIPITMGDYRLEPLDCMRVTDIAKNAYLVPCMHVQHVFDGGMSTYITAPTFTSEEDSSQFKGALAQKMARYEAELVTAKQVIAQKVSADEVEALVGSFGYVTTKELDATYATIAQLDATEARIQTLETNSLKASDLSAEVAKLGYATVENLNAATARIGTLEITSVKTDELESKVGTFGYLKVSDAEAIYVKTTTLDAVNGTIANLQTSVANIEKAYVDEAKVNTLIAGKGYLTEAEVGTLIAGKGFITALEADTLIAKKGYLTEAEVDTLVVGKGYLDEAEVNTLIASKGYFTEAQVNTLVVSKGYMTSAQVDDLVAEKGYITSLETQNLLSGYATINLANVEAGSITSAMIGNGVVGNAQIADGSITDAKIVELSANKITAGTLSVERLEIRGSTSSLVYALNDITGALQAQNVDTLNGEILTPRTITADKIVANAITSNEIAANAITANEILAGAITTDKLAAGAVTAAKIAAGAITANAIAADAVTADKIATGAVTADSIAADAITSDKIVAGAITAEKIAAQTITANEIAAGTITATQLASNSVTAAKIKAGAVNTSELATNAVTAVKISAGAITTEKLAANAVTAEKIDVNDLFAQNITATGTISGATLVGDLISIGENSETSVIKLCGGVGEIFVTAENEDTDALYISAPCLGLNANSVCNGYSSGSGFVGVDSTAYEDYSQGHVRLEAYCDAPNNWVAQASVDVSATSDGASVGFHFFDSNASYSALLDSRGFSINAPTIFPNNTKIMGTASDGTTRECFNAQNGSNETVVGAGNYAAANGNTSVRGNDIAIWSAAAGNVNYTPYYRKGHTFSIAIETSGYVTGSSKNIWFNMPFARPIIGSPTVTVTGQLKLRQNNNYTHGSSSSVNVTPSSIAATLGGSHWLRINATMSATTNATNNSPIGIYAYLTITFS